MDMKTAGAHRISNRVVSGFRIESGMTIGTEQIPRLASLLQMDGRHADPRTHNMRYRQTQNDERVAATSSPPPVMPDSLAP